MWNVGVSEKLVWISQIHRILIDIDRHTKRITTSLVKVVLTLATRKRLHDNTTCSVDGSRQSLKWNVTRHNTNSIFCIQRYLVLAVQCSRNQSPSFGTWLLFYYLHWPVWQIFIMQMLLYLHPHKPSFRCDKDATRYNTRLPSSWFYCPLRSVPYRAAERPHYALIWRHSHNCGEDAEKHKDSLYAILSFLFGFIKTKLQ